MRMLLLTLPCRLLLLLLLLMVSLLLALLLLLLLPRRVRLLRPACILNPGGHANACAVVEFLRMRTSPCCCS
jgi:hypothetical protein